MLNMQKFSLIISVFFFLFSSLAVFAQENYSDDSPTTPNEEVSAEPTEEQPTFPSIAEFAAQQTYIKPTFEVIGLETSLGHDIRPAFQVIIPNVETSDASKAWMKMMKSYGADVEEKEAIIVAEGARIKRVQDRAVNVYAKFQQKVEGSGVVAIFETGKDEFAGEDIEMNEGVETLLSDFATDFAKEDAEQRLKTVEKELKNLENLLDKLKRQNEGYHKSITKSEGGIAKSEGTIDQSKQQQEITESSIEMQEESETYLENEEAAKALKKQERELKKLERTKERNRKNIDRQEQNIVKNKENIVENGLQQVMVQEAIVNQRQEVRNAKKYLKLFE